MLCRKFRQIIYNKSNWNNNLQHFIISTRLSKKCVLIDGFWAVNKVDIRGMSSLRFVLKDLSITRLWSAWKKSYFVSTVVKRCRRDRGVRDVIQRFRHTWLRPRQTILLSATAAFKSHKDEPESPINCEKNITDEELQALLHELESVTELSRNTLYCTSCGRRLVIDKKLAGVSYCSCKESKSSDELSEGWVPYMEAEDVIVWRKQYKPGQPYYAYKVYGRYKELRAQDFAAVQVDGAYRRVWDAAVASLSVVERQANGVEDQAVLHWEVLWPRLFANRDYVYIRRHKEFDIERSSAPTPTSTVLADPQRPNVHSRAKRKAMEEAKDKGKVEESSAVSNKVYIIASRSCEHAKVPESKHAIRVADFWSHMVIKTLDGPDKPGMEFVLTYYEEPAVGGLPCGVATWATGRAAPAFLERQRRAAAEYRTWRATRTHQDLPDYIPFGAETEATLDKVVIREQDMESSKHGPELENIEARMHDQSTQTDIDQRTSASETVEAQVAGEVTDSGNAQEQLLPHPDSKTTNETCEKLDLENIQNVVEKLETKQETHSIVIERSSSKVDSKQDGGQNIQKTGKGEQETQSQLKTQTAENETQIVIKEVQIVADKKQDSTQVKEDGGQEKQNGGQEKEIGESKEEKEGEEDEEEIQSNGSWWRYLYPFYYFA